MPHRRYWLVVILITISASTFNVCAQSQPDKYERRWRDSTETSDRKINIIKTHVLAYVIGDFNFTYERLSRRSARSLVVKFDYQRFTSVDFDLSGVALRAGLRYYLTRKRQPPAGYYIQPCFTTGKFTVQDKIQGRGVSVSEIGGGLIFGKQWAIGKRLTVEVFLGGQYLNLSATSYKVRGATETFQAILGTTTGFRF